MLRAMLLYAVQGHPMIPVKTWMGDLLREVIAAAATVVAAATTATAVKTCLCVLLVTAIPIALSAGREGKQLYF